MDVLLPLWLGVAILAALVAAIEPRRRVVFIVAAVVAGAIAGGCFWLRGGTRATGGVRLVYELDPAVAPEGSAPGDSVSRAAEVARERVAALGFPAAIVKHEGRVILIEIGGAIAPDKLAELERTLAVWGRLTFQMVDDASDFFRPFAGAEGSPPGLRVEAESVYLSPTKMGPVYHAFLPAGVAEPERATLARLQAWTKTLTVPEGRQISFEKIERLDPDRNVAEYEGWRTHFLFAEAEITGAMIKDAQARPGDGGSGGWMVALEFTSDGASRFEEVTANNIKRRFAIVLDGIVQSAPVIQTKIAGGHAVITMGAGALEEQAASAKRLEAILRAGELPAPLVLAIEEKIPGVLGDGALIALWVLSIASALGVLAFMAVSVFRGSPRRAPGSP